MIDTEVLNYSRKCSHYFIDEGSFITTMMPPKKKKKKGGVSSSFVRCCCQNNGVVVVSFLSYHPFTYSLLLVVLC